MTVDRSPVVRYARVRTGGVGTTWPGLFSPALVADAVGLVDGCGHGLCSMVVDTGTQVPWLELDAAARALLAQLPGLFARIAAPQNLY